MTEQIIECVPNYSEGRDKAVIRKIVDAIASVEGVKVLNVDPGEAANRTVVTFVGRPECVVEGAFQGAAAAARLIDMRRHQGTHPRIGATDVLPLVPVSGITLEECALLARGLAERMARELGIPCYLYEAAALKPEHRNLAVCRAGEYEALHKKLADPALQPDIMPQDLSAAERTGCSVVGARNFLIAVNWNLNTTSVPLAHAVACDVREIGRPLREGDPETGEPKRDAEGRIIRVPGTLKCTKAIGWYIEEYGIAQVSMNMTDISVTPLHVAYEEVCRCARNRGLQVTGTEIIGMVPRRVLTDAGRYFLTQQNRPVDVADDVLIQTAIEAMHLDDLCPFNPQEKVL